MLLLTYNRWQVAFRIESCPARFWSVCDCLCSLGSPPGCWGTYPDQVFCGPMLAGLEGTLQIQVVSISQLPKKNLEKDIWWNTPPPPQALLHCMHKTRVDKKEQREIRTLNSKPHHTQKKNNEFSSHQHGMQITPYAEHGKWRNAAWPCFCDPQLTHYWTPSCHLLSLPINPRLVCFF